MFPHFFVANKLADRSSASASNGNQSGIPDVDCETISTENTIHPAEKPLFSLNDRWFSTALPKHCVLEIIRSSGKSAACIAD
jgi:hypothetical protein